MTRDGLRTPFPKEMIGKLPATAKRPELDYVGHAAVTDRLNHETPEWAYTVDEMFSMDGVCWIRGTMTIEGISRPEYGDGKDPKEAIGNFIRRAAMRFGVALDLWSKQELQTSGQADGEAAGSVEPTAPTSGTPVEPEGKQVEDPSGSPPATAEQWAHANAAGVTLTKARAVAKTLGIDVGAQVSGEQLDRIIAAYGEIQEKKAKAS